MADNELDPEFEQLLTFLKEHRGFDFTGYKRTSLQRRVRRQMQVVGVERPAEYQEYLEVHPDEFSALFNMILINVTDFFRDVEAWDHLATDVLSDMLSKSPVAPVRVWSAGCSSGEEAYSIAMLLADIIGIEAFRDRVKIYATDVDESALDFARHATFTRDQLANVSEERIERYFEEVNGSLVFRSDLRRSVIFGRNDLVQDAPISRIDLLICRNTLMYFNAEQQARILRRLHFALRPDGVLFLGKAEMILGHTSLFSPIDVKQRMFGKVAADVPNDRVALANGGGRERMANNGPTSRLLQDAMQDSPLAHVVIDRDGILVAANNRAESLFTIQPRDIGKPFQDVELCYRPVELRAVLSQALEERRPIWVREVEWSRAAGKTLHLDVQVIPHQDSDGTTLGASVYFSDVTSFQQLQGDLEFANHQLETAYEELQSTNEELETTNEELQSTIEELETTNEELQSSNEELETMNEELQSMNDELHTSNDELRERTTEVDELNRYMGSIVESLTGSVVVVDRDLRVQVWNLQAEDMWGLRGEEAVGQHLLNLDIGLQVEQLRPLIWRVLGNEGSDEAAPAEDNHLVLDAINRRGRSIRVRVKASELRVKPDGVSGAILVVEELSRT